MRYKLHFLAFIASLIVVTFSPPSVGAVEYFSPTTGSDRPSGVLRGASIPEKNWHPGHRGVDLALPVGAEVLAAANGVVHFAGLVADRPAVSITHSDGIRTTYTPVQAQVSSGEEVKAGQVIGVLAAPVDGYPGLHWGALIAEDIYINPLSLLKQPIIRLKAL